MAKAKRQLHTEAEKTFYDVFTKLTPRHNTWNIWCDFITLFAISLANVMEPDQGIREEREELYLATAKAYTKEELEIFVELASLTIMALDKNPAQDFLGNLYMSMDFGNSWQGQFFTPWNIAHMMAKMIMGNCNAEIQEKGFVSVNDPTCGAGCMLLAAAEAYRNGIPGEERNFQTDVLFVGQDIDPVVAKMCYIQLSLLGCAGYVAIGNTFADPVRGSVLNPVMDSKSSLWFTPMWYSPLWQYRRISLMEHCVKEA